ncbi:MAG: Tfp pilus assembly protein FimT/FimU [Phycisphaerales bacterium JB065]
MRGAPSHHRDRDPLWSSPSNRARSAFTLIEVLIAIGVVVAMIAIATPAIVSSFGDRRIEAEAERLAAAMASLRAEAVRQRATLALYLEPAEGEHGGELFIGPLESSDDAIGFSGGEEDSPSVPMTPSDEQSPRTRSVFGAGTPLTLTIERPVKGLASDLLGASGETVQSGFARLPERIRIAVCTPSGQILASRPLWLHDERSMFRVEVGRGVGNAVLSSMQIIPEADALEDDDAPGAEQSVPSSLPDVPDTGGGTS